MGKNTNKSANKKVSVIIPVYNKWELTAECLQSLARTSPPGAVEVLVVDNASSDQTSALCPELGKSLFPHYFKYIRNEINRNFAGACNQGAENAIGPWLFFLNNDTVLKPDWLPPLLNAFMDDPTLGAVGPLLTFPDDTVQHAGVFYYVGLGAGHLHLGLPAENHLVHAKRNFQAITAAAMMVPSELFTRVGGFHEEYANGCEDLDFCATIVNQGYKTTCVSASVIHHLEGQSPGRHDAEEDNFEIFRKRCGDKVRPDIHLWAEADDLDLEVTETGDIFPVVRPEISDRLLAVHNKGANPVRLFDALDEYPYWEKGYELMAGFMESIKMFAEAVTIRVQQVKFFPTRERALKLMAVSKKAGLTEVTESATETLMNLNSVLEDRELLRLRLMDSLEFYTSEGYEGLAAKYRTLLSDR